MTFPLRVVRDGPEVARHSSVKLGSGVLDDRGLVRGVHQPIHDYHYISKRPHLPGPDRHQESVPGA